MSACDIKGAYLTSRLSWDLGLSIGHADVELGCAAYSQRHSEGLMQMARLVARNFPIRPNTVMIRNCSH
jgi:hypothetical protein